jgi:hypothetical protein
MNNGGSGNGTAGSNVPGAGSGTGGTGTGGVVNPGGGANAGGVTNGGASGGTPAGGQNSAGTGGGVEPGDTMPPRPLNVTAAMDEHRHNINGRPAAMDNRAPKMMGKLIVDVGVDNGGAYEFGLKRGFHVYGVNIVHCQIAESPDAYQSKTPAFNGNCRLETFDGVDRDPSINVSPADSVTGKLQKALTDLHAQFPEEDWGYFLNADGTVRWSDVGITGYSHGATSAARWAKHVRLWRVVSRSGPRDNICGQYGEGQCPAGVISSWLDEESATPVERLYGFVGNGDSQYEDILFAMDRMKYMGAPTDINAVAPPYNNSRRLYINGGHSSFDSDEFNTAMGVAWSVPPENMTYAAGL